MQTEIDVTKPPIDLVLSKKIVQNIAIDAFRDLRVHELGTSARPDRAINENKKFESIRSDPWKQLLARELAYFATSVDPSSAVWPYDRLAAKLDREGISLPPAMTIESAVAEVLNELFRIDPKWFDKNIATPMGIRAATVGSVQFTNDASDRESYIERKIAIPTVHIELASILFTDLTRSQRHLRDCANSQGMDQDEREVLEASALVIDSILDALDESSTDVQGVDDIPRSQLLAQAIARLEDDQARRDPRGTVARRAGSIYVAEAAGKVNDARYRGPDGDAFISAIQEQLMRQLILDPSVRSPTRPEPTLVLRGTPRREVVDPAWITFYQYVRPLLQQRNHGGGKCPMARPRLLGGSGSCADCESDFTWVVTWFITHPRKPTTRLGRSVQVDH